MHIDRWSSAPFQPCIARENRQLARRVVDVDSYHGKAAHRCRRVSKQHPRLRVLQLKVPQPAVQNNIRARSAVPGNRPQCDGAVWGNSRNAAVVELDLGLPVVACHNLSSRKQWSIHQRGICQNLPALHQAYLAFNIAQTRRTARALSGPHVGGARRKCRQHRAKRSHG
jgi:hypothetical protein